MLLLPWEVLVRRYVLDEQSSSSAAFSFFLQTVLSIGVVMAARRISLDVLIVFFWLFSTTVCFRTRPTGRILASAAGADAFARRF